MSIHIDPVHALEWTVAYEARQVRFVIVHLICVASQPKRDIIRCHHEPLMTKRDSIANDGDLRNDAVLTTYKGNQRFSVESKLKEKSTERQ